MLSIYYPIKTLQDLIDYLDVYGPLVVNTAKRFGIDLTSSNFMGDHLGLQVLSKEEFDAVDQTLLTYATLVHDTVIHERRNRVYRFAQPIKLACGISFKGIETFEPKPNADLSKLKPGIEHVAFKVTDFAAHLADCQKREVPIDKIGEWGPSKFFKTSFVNLVEIEFRTDFLGD